MNPQTALTLLLLGASLSPAFAQQSAPPPLAVVAKAGPDANRHDFKTVSLLAQRSVVHTFTLRNTGAAPVTVRGARSACGCISTVAGSAGAGEGTVVAPGATTEVRVELDLGKVPAGPLRKQIEVVGEGAASPVLATLEMVGTLAPVAVFDPPLLDLGRVEAGAGKQQEVSVALDARAVADGRSWPEPAVVTPSGTVSTAVRVTPLPEAPAEATDAAGVRRLVRRYRLTLGKDAPVGNVSGTLTFPAPAEPAALRGAVAFVSGEVYGDLTSTPQLVAFAGGQRVRRVRLEASGAAAFAGLKVTSASPHLTARLVPAAAGATRELEVTLAEGAPASLTESSVEVTTAAGLRLVLPVRIYPLPGTK